MVFREAQSQIIWLNRQLSLLKNFDTIEVTCQRDTLKLEEWKTSLSCYFCFTSLKSGFEEQTLNTVGPSSKLQSTR